MKGWESFLKVATAVLNQLSDVEMEGVTNQKKRGAYNKIILEPWQEKFIKDNFFKMTNPQIADAIGMTLTTTRMNCYAMGLKRIDLEYWCETSVRFLRLYYKKIGDTEMAEIFTKHFPKQKKWTKKHIEKKRRYLFLKRTEKEIQDIKTRNTELGRFSICAVKMWQTRGSAKVGDVRVWKHGDCPEMAFVKTKEGFVPHNRWLWVQAYGEIESTDIIRAKPGSPVIAELHHLEKISMAENAVKNKLQPRSIIKTMFKIKDNLLAQQIADEYPELVQVKKNMLNLKRKINESKRKINGAVNG